MIRAATPADLDAIVAVHVAAFRAGNSPHLPPESADRMTKERSAAGWTEVLESLPRESVVLVIEEHDGIVGVVGAGAAREGDANGGELYALYVDPPHWGSGCGAALDAAAREHLTERGFPDAMLWVLEANERACRFYERQGWSHDGSRRDHLGAPAVRYRVAL